MGYDKTMRRRGYSPGFMTPNMMLLCGETPDSERLLVVSDKETARAINGIWTQIAKDKLQRDIEQEVGFLPCQAVAFADGEQAKADLALCPSVRHKFALVPDSAMPPDEAGKWMEEVSRAIVGVDGMTAIIGRMPVVPWQEEEAQSEKISFFAYSDIREREADIASHTDEDAKLEAISGAVRACPSFDEAELQQDEIKSSVDQQWARKQQEAHGGAALLKALASHWERTMDDPPKTGFGDLDKLLGGGLYDGVYVLSAASGVGKTTLAMQIGINAVEKDESGQTRLVIFSTEMSEAELTAKTLSRFTREASVGHAGENVAVDYRDISQGKKFAALAGNRLTAVKNATKRWTRIQDRIMCFPLELQGKVTDIDQMIRRLSHASGGRGPIVIVDYLQQLEPLNDRQTEKQNLDNAIKTLKRLSVDCFCPVIVISSQSKGCQREGKADSTNPAGSAEIGFTANVVMTLQRLPSPDGTGSYRVGCMGGRMEFVEDSTLTLTKNRFGERGKVGLMFDSHYSRYADPDPKSLADVTF